MSGWSAGWRPALRIAWRDAARAKGRTALVLVMIALPVLAVTAADTLYATQDVSTAEAPERRMGSADALVEAYAGPGRVLQAPDPEEFEASGFGANGDGAGPMPGEEPTRVDAAALRDVLGPETRVLPTRTFGYVRYATDRGTGEADVTEVDLRDPLTDGLFELTGGRLPEAADEVVVNAAVAERGPGIGEAFEVPDGQSRTVVGTVESPSTGFPTVVGLADAFADEVFPGGTRSWLVDSGDVAWPEVLALNDLGAAVTSRAVLADPPPVPPEVAEMTPSGIDEAALAALALIVTMALLEVVLLAGPAFAVSARRLSRSLALLAAAGGTPRQARRVVLAGGVVLGLLASATGLVLGLLAAGVLTPVLQEFSDQRFGPFDVEWTHLLPVACFGLVSALLAAVVPARIASRQDVVAVLAGRRGDGKPSRRNPLVGLVLLGGGVALATYGSRQASNGEYSIALSAIVTILGMVLLVPVVVALVARLSRRMPLSLRYAARDAARHRTRTVPAVAAVAATVAGVVALGIASGSDAKQSEATYQPQLPMGDAIVRGVDPSTMVVDDAGNPLPTSPADLDAVAGVVRDRLPGADVELIRGLLQEGGDRYVYSNFALPPGSVPKPDTGLGREPLVAGWLSAFGSEILVADGGQLPAALGLELDKDAREVAARTLRGGGAVVLTDRPGVTDGVREVRVTTEEGDYTTGESTGRRTTTLPAAYVDWRGPGLPDATVEDRSFDQAPAAAVVSPEAAAKIGVPVGDLALVMSGARIDEAAQQDLTERVAALAPDADVYVERGYVAPDSERIVALVLFGLGAVLMLGGTLTATFLALADARPDLATLAAVGASPRRRRGVAAAYALVVGGVGSVLGAAVGFVPGIAVSYPLTRDYGLQDADHYLGIPWLLIAALVVGLPLLTAAVVGLTARARLPLASRVD